MEKTFYVVVLVPAWASNARYFHPAFIPAGELAPSLHARVDPAMYHIGLKLCRNFFVLPQAVNSEQ